MTSTPAARFATLCEQFDLARQRLRVPGASIGILADGAEFCAGFGVTNIAHPLPVTADTLFQVGSITKTFVGTVAQKLADAGRLDLDAPVRAWVPELVLRDADAAARMSMRHLLMHTAGWAGDYFDDFGWGDDALARMVAALANLESLTPPGATWSYNNAGFALAGLVLQRIMGKPFEQVVRDEVFTPLGLQDTWFFPHEIMTRRFASGHHVGPDFVSVAQPWPMFRANHAAGGIISTAPDLLRYARAHMQDGLLSARGMAAMQHPAMPATGIYGMGLTWWCGTTAGEAFIEHTGATWGQTALLRIVPARRFAVIILANAGAGRALRAEISHAAMQLYLGSGMPGATLQDCPPALLADYCGRYTAQMTNLEITAEAGQLWLRQTELGHFPLPDQPPPPAPLDAPPAVRVALCGPDQLVVADQPITGGRGEFVRDSAGRIAWLRWGARLHRPV